MGRYYGGDIEGKFWFGVQSSYDAQHFGVEPDGPLHIYSMCGTETVDAVDTVCNCSPDCIATEQNEITFSFRASDMDRVKQGLVLIDEKMLNLLPEWRKVQQLRISNADMNEIEEAVESCVNGKEEEGARYLLGVQILRCLQEKGVCNFWCEL